ncbi:hypothetical protein BT96DRAFT_987627 [Gymnopus androsaceus JB14]|uniref:Uncharacterized protein n=1 Tax=Gymnopus androsaceus JB14 TaxID=1447944 RepID=A0A6A4IB00_9AGAR|nr:hypothetical protein BT96DRAFT_987627 [Gymnopus androsaceus JB14]
MSSSSAPLSACPPNSTSQILVDDTDPRIVYSAGWVQEGNPEWNVKAPPMVLTSFQASQLPLPSKVWEQSVGIQVFGTVGLPDGSPTSTYQVDNAVPSTFTFNANGMTNYRVQFYSSQRWILAHIPSL